MNSFAPHFTKILAFISLGLGLCMGFSQSASATIVRIETNVGNLDVNLYDELTPVTVENFLRYVENARYDGTFFHRLDRGPDGAGFVLQGGGFTMVDPDPEGLVTEPVEAYEAVTNEPLYSNVRGTIAMAKLGGLPDSATSQWYFNVVDNSEILDPDSNGSGGYTVFGELDPDSLALLLEINEYIVFNYDNGVFANVPLINYTAVDYASGVELTQDNFVQIRSVSILESDPNTAINLDPVENTLINEKDDEGGSILYLLPFILVSLKRKEIKR